LRGGDLHLNLQVRPLQCKLSPLSLSSVALHTVQQIVIHEFSKRSADFGKCSKVARIYDCHMHTGFMIYNV